MIPYTAMKLSLLDIWMVVLWEEKTLYLGRKSNGFYVAWGWLCKVTY
jgi:hypothetical protein